MMRWQVLVVLLCMPACGDGNGRNAPDDERGAGGSSADPVLESGPGAFDEAFETSPEFVTRMPELALGLPGSPHQRVQIFYSRNIEPVLGAEAFGPLPIGTVATTALIPGNTPPLHISTQGDYASPRGCRGTFGSVGIVEVRRIDADFTGVDCDVTFSGRVALAKD